MLLGRGEDHLRRVQENLEFASRKTESEVADSQSDSCPPCLLRETEHEHLTGVLRRGSGKSWHVGVAADDTIHDHDVGFVHLAVRLGEIHDAALDTILELSLIHISEPTRLGMISYAVFCL